MVCKQRLVFTFVAFHCTEPPGFSGRRRRARPGRPPRSWRKRGRRPHWPGRARQRCAPRTCAEAAWVSGRESVGGGVAGFALRVERLEESLAGRLACLRKGAAQVACLVYLIDPRGRALLCDELETGPPVVVIAAACNAPAPCQAMLWRETEPTKRQNRRPGHAPPPLPKYVASQASLNAPMVEAICGVEANICSIMPPQLSLQHSARHRVSRGETAAGPLGNALTRWASRGRRSRRRSCSGRCRRCSPSWGSRWCSSR